MLVRDIALNCGFKSQHHFSRTFKNTKGSADRIPLSDKAVMKLKLIIFSALLVHCRMYLVRTASPSNLIYSACATAITHKYVFLIVKDMENPYMKKMFEGFGPLMILSEPNPFSAGRQEIHPPRDRSRLWKK